MGLGATHCLVQTIDSVGAVTLQSAVPSVTLLCASQNCKKSGHALN
jgi:hypothetical protein